MKRIDCKISGIVQGVNFRYFTKKEAEKLEIVGEVKNCRDGTVCLIAEGDEDKLHQFIEVLKKGPSYAEVSDIKIEWEDPSGGFSGFNIVY